MSRDRNSSRAHAIANGTLEEREVMCVHCGVPVVEEVFVVDGDVLDVALCDGCTRHEQEAARRLSDKAAEKWRRNRAKGGK